MEGGYFSVMYSYTFLRAHPSFLCADHRWDSCRRARSLSILRLPPAVRVPPPAAGACHLSSALWTGAPRLLERLRASLANASRGKRKAPRELHYRYANRSWKTPRGATGSPHNEGLQLILLWAGAPRSLERLSARPISKRRAPAAHSFWNWVSLRCPYRLSPGH